MKLRSHLIAVILGTLLPALTTAAVLLVFAHNHVRQATDRGLTDTARALSLVIDRELSASIAALNVLAASESLERGDLPTFYAVARSALATQGNWENLVLLDLVGQPLMNLRVPFGAPLPPSGNLEQVREVARTRTPAISNLFTGRRSETHLLAVDVPVLNQGTVRYVLGASFSPATLSATLRQQRFPVNAVIALLDRRKIIIARTRVPERFVGQPATPDLSAKMDEVSEGAFRLFTKEGTAVYAAFSRSSLSGWTIALGLPLPAVDTPFRSSLWLFAGAGAGLILLGIVCAVAVAHRISRSILRLSTAARALVNGEYVELGRSQVAEVNTVADAVRLAGQERRRGEAERSRLLLETNHQRESAETLAEVGRLISQSLEPGEVGDAVVRAVSRLLGAQIVVLYRLEGLTADLMFVAGIGPSVHSGRRLERGTATAGLATQEGQPVTTADVLTDSRIVLSPRARAEIAASQFRAVLAVPLLARGRASGALVIVDSLGRIFTDDDIRLMQSFSDQAAIALENARLHQKTEVHLQHTEALLAVSQAASSTLDLTEVFRRTTRAMVRALGADVGAAWKLSPDLATAMPVAGYHLPKGLAESLDSIPEAARIAVAGETRCLSGPACHFEAQGTLPAEAVWRKLLGDHRSLLIVPLRLNDTVGGGFAIVWRTQPYQCRDTELRLIEGMAQSAAVAFENARVHHELQDHHARLETLLNVALEMSRIQPLETLLKRIAAAGSRLLDSESVGFRLLEGDELVFSCETGETLGVMPPPPLKVGASLNGVVVTTGQTLMVLNPADDPRVHPEYRDRLRPYRAWLGVPVKVGDRVVGVLSVRTRRLGFTHDEQTLATALASHAATAFENARLYQESERAYQELSATQGLLTQAQKMEAVGRLAGGVAHDFNNLITVVIGRSQMMLKILPPAHPLRRYAELIKLTAARAANVTKQLLAFSRKQILQPKIVNINDVLNRGVLTILRRLIGEDVALSVVQEPSLATVRVDPCQLEQVLLNLAVNARDAMPDGGRLTITTANFELRHMSKDPEFRPGRFVMLSVTDTGCGMSAETMAHIFEPFFTTKDQGKGTGLGLATVYGIVKQSGGYIEVQSEVGIGTTFRVYLPPVDQIPENEAPRLPGPTTRGSETILLVEDEDEVRELACELLEAEGYTILEAATPVKALDLADHYRDAIDLVVTDVIMPHMSGSKLGEQLKGRRHEIKIVYLSGYTADTLTRHGVLNPGVVLIQKPFDPEAFLRTVRTVLDSKEGAPPIPDTLGVGHM